MPTTVNTKENAPSDDVYLMFSLLTEENKEKAIQFIADLKEMQQSLLP